MTNSTSIQLGKRIDTAFPQWQPTQWEDYLKLRDAPTEEIIGLFFNQGYLFIDMGNEGINHARFNNIFTMLFFIWFARQTGGIFDDLGGCLIEKPNIRAASPDQVFYIGEGSPQWQEGEPRRINLDNWRGNNGGAAFWFNQQIANL